MATSNFGFICLLIASIVLAGIQGNPSGDTALRLTIGEDINSMSQMGHYSVNCSLDIGITSFSKVTSLTIHKAKEFGKPGEFHPLATVDLWSSKARALLDTLDTADVEVQGSIGFGNEPNSELSISWEYPQTCTSFPREYMCVAKGLDKMDRPKTLAEISFTTMTNDLVCKASSKGLEATRLQDLTSRVDQVQQAVDSLSSLEENLLKELRQLKFVSLLSSFDISTAFEGKRYLSSKDIAPFDIARANYQCKLMGGHLVEWASKREYDFVLNFVMGLKGDNFFTGANDIAREGQWKFWHSGKPLHYPNWGPGQPNNLQGDQHCHEFRRAFNASSDLSCKSRVNFVCEVPA